MLNRKKINILIFCLMIIAFMPTDIFASKTAVSEKKYYGSGTAGVCINGLACTTLTFSDFDKVDNKSTYVTVTSSNYAIQSDYIVYTVKPAFDGHHTSPYFRYLNFYIYVTVPAGYRLAELSRYEKWRYMDETWGRGIPNYGATYPQAAAHREGIRVGFHIGSVGLFARLPDTGGTQRYRYNAETLYIGMYPNTTTVYYNANGGTGAPGSTWHQYASTSYIASGQPTRRGYAFGGWNTNNTGTGANYSPSQNATYAFPAQSSLTLYAKWVPNKYKIKFNPNAGTGIMDDQTFTYDKTQKLTSNRYTRLNYRFLEWNTKADGTGTAFTNAQDILNLTDVNNATINLYAQWVEDIPLIIRDGEKEIRKDESGNYVIENAKARGLVKVCKELEIPE